jgi:hypothetical protein
MPIVQYLQKMEHDSMAGVRDAQAAFAKEHRITLKQGK